MRILALDVGRRRVGLAISDASATLARPLMTLQVTNTTTIASVVKEIERLSAEEDGIGEVVVGLPRHLDGSESEETAQVRRFVSQLRTRITVPVLTQDERLTSREAESLLAQRESDWKKRKAALDSAAAAVILQEYLDRR